MFDKTGSRARTLWTLAITSVGLFMVVLDNLVVSTALPVIRVDLGASIEELEWTVNASRRRRQRSHRRWTRSSRPAPRRASAARS